MQPPCTAAHCTAAHPRPSPCTRILTHIPVLDPDLPPSLTAPNLAVPQQCRSPVSTVAHLLYTRVPPCPRKSPYIYISMIRPIIAPPSFRSSNSENSPCSRSTDRNNPDTCPVYSIMPQSPRASSEVSQACHIRSPLPHYSDWLSLTQSCCRSRIQPLTERPYPRRTRSVQCHSGPHQLSSR